MFYNKESFEHGEFDPISHVGDLPGGARTLGFYAPGELAQLEEMAVAVDTCGPAPQVPRVLMGGVRVARRTFPGQQIDIVVTREPFRANDPKSFATADLGIHIDREPFLVMSSDQPTVFYDDLEGRNPRQALPGALVYVPGDGPHSASTPDSDGVRVRAKFRPMSPSGAGQFSQEKKPRETLTIRELAADPLPPAAYAAAARLVEGLHQK
jgi:hypothetical protein